MSDSLGAINSAQGDGEVFLGRDMGHQRDYSEDVAGEIDEEVKPLIERGHDEAWEILVEHRDVLDELVLALIDKETARQGGARRDLRAGPEAAGARLRRARGRRPAKDIPPVLTPDELALLGPSDVADLKGSTNGSADGRGRARSTANGGRRAMAPPKTTARRTTKRSG